MLTAYIQQVVTENNGLEEPAATRDRLKDRFPKGATRRMTQLGMVIGAVLEPLSPNESDTLVYASEYAESRALEAYLDSFPTASPTLFQTSIHPSAVQQFLIQRQQPVGSLFPMTGRSHLGGQALQVALLAPTPRAIVCGGEERGTWLLEANAASARTFAFALSITRNAEGAIGQISLDPACVGREELSLGTLFEALHARASLLRESEGRAWFSLRWS
ncbi:MAG TPA: hypothetical protein VFT72_03610 [Opitutaceae bacterium]|nr:hypothetical protein [Opitutaceae bacterium]